MNWPTSCSTVQLIDLLGDS